MTTPWFGAACDEWWNPSTAG